ncbi:MAG: IS200/IS605 family transposase [Bacteroides sp.]|nr:IS200/IS605 family transposase [Bacteroides sp.]
MANTYSDIYLHLVFAVKSRQPFLTAIYRPRLYHYILGIAERLGHHPVTIGGTDDHIHILLGYNTKQLIPDLVRDLKAASSKFINDRHFIRYRFEWQRGYAVFSNSHRELSEITAYINNQTEHHKNMTVEQELRLILDRLGVEYDERYLLSD